MEGAGLDPVADPRAVEAAAQLAGGFAGEGEHQRVAGLGGPGDDAVGDAAGEHPGLAGPGARDDGDEAGFGDDGPTLIRVEVVEQRVRIHHVMVRRSDERLGSMASEHVFSCHTPRVACGG